VKPPANLTLADRDELKAFLRKNGLAPDKQFGQNFLVDQSTLDAIVAAADLSEKDRVVEIGGGLGTLTRELAAKCEHLTTLEYDEKIFPALTRNTAEFENVELQNLDVRKFIPPTEKYKLVANIPYYLTSPIFRQFFVETADRPELAVLLIQREVAEKISNPKKLSILALEVRVFAEAEIVKFVPAESFLPPPKVESAVVKITPKKNPEVGRTDLADFFRTVHAGFRAPRKKIGGSLVAGLPLPKKESLEVLKNSGVNPELRPEDLQIKDWLSLMTAWRDAEKSKK